MIKIIFGNKLVGGSICKITNANMHGHNILENVPILNLSLELKKIKSLIRKVEMNKINTGPKRIIILESLSRELNSHQAPTNIIVRLVNKEIFSTLLNCFEISRSG